MEAVSRAVKADIGAFGRVAGEPPVKPGFVGALMDKAALGDIGQEIRIKTGHNSSAVSVNAGAGLA